MPVLNALGDSNNDTGLEFDWSLAPLLIPATAIDTDEHLHGLVMNMPVIAASRFKRDIYRSAVLGIERSDVTVADKVLGIVGIEVSTWPDAIVGAAFFIILTKDAVASALRARQASTLPTVASSTWGMACTHHR